MSDATFDSDFPRKQLHHRVFGTKTSRRSSAFYGYSLSILAMGIGWLLRDYGFINPEEGFGYWLGIVGGSMMLILLLYPLRKRVRALSFLGRTTHWFKAHMIFGVLGPILVLFHSNFSLGSFNSRVALYCMLLVAGSGVIGRHIYAGIHSGLYGEKTSLDELRLQLEESLRRGEGMAAFLPEFSARLQVLSDEVQGDKITGSMSAGSSLIWTFRKYSVWLSLWQTARQEINRRAAESPTVAANANRLRKATATYTRSFVGMVGRVAQFTLYERLFSLWHVLHLPLFFMMIISALLHVLAVHMY